MREHVFARNYEEIRAFMKSFFAWCQPPNKQMQRARIHYKFVLRLGSGASLICGVMRHSPNRLASSVIALLSACYIDAADARGDSADFCAQLTSFSQGLAHSEQREITLFADWSEPTIACRPDTNDDPSRMFCDWLVENAAIEYMEVNVWKVIGCLTGEERKPFAVGTSFAGKTRFSEVRLAGTRSLDVEIEYSVRQGSDPDRLHVLVQQN